MNKKTRRKTLIKKFYKKTLLRVYLYKSGRSKRFKKKKFQTQIIKKLRHIKYFAALRRKYINFLTRGGGFLKAERFFYFTQLAVFSSLCLCTYKAFLKMKKLKIPFKLLGVRRRGKVMGIPIPISVWFQWSHASRRLVRFFQENASFSKENFAKEFVNVLRINSPALLLNREDMFKTAALNKKYLRFRW